MLPERGYIRFRFKVPLASLPVIHRHGTKEYAVLIFCVIIYVGKCIYIVNLCDGSFGIADANM
jgi:hypothetical protein